MLDGGYAGPKSNHVGIQPGRRKGATRLVSVPKKGPRTPFSGGARKSGGNPYP